MEFWAGVVLGRSNEGMAMFSEKDRRWSLSNRIFLFATIALVLHGTRGLAGGQNVQFETYEGTYVSHKGNAIKISTADGEKTFAILRASSSSRRRDSQPGTSIAVTGWDHVTFLKPPLYVHFVAAQDRNNQFSLPLDEIAVMGREKLDTVHEVMAPFDESNDHSFHRFIARVDQVDLAEGRISATVQEGSGSQRYVFSIDPEKTRVRYDLPDLALAQPGDAVRIRALFNGAESGNLVASEIRVTRPNPFDDSAELAEATPPPAAEDAQNEPNEQLPKFLDGGAESDAAMAEESSEADSDFDANSQDANQPDAVPFDFGFDQAPRLDREQTADSDRRPAKVPGRRWYKIN
jgi:hypothetical protein